MIYVKRISPNFCHKMSDYTQNLCHWFCRQTKMMNRAEWRENDAVPLRCLSQSFFFQGESFWFLSYCTQITCLGATHTWCVGEQKQGMRLKFPGLHCVPKYILYTRQSVFTCLFSNLVRKADVQQAHKQAISTKISPSQLKSPAIVYESDAQVWSLFGKSCDKNGNVCWPNLNAFAFW